MENLGLARRAFGAILIVMDGSGGSGCRQADYSASPPGLPPAPTTVSAPEISVLALFAVQDFLKINNCPASFSKAFFNRVNHKWRTLDISPNNMYHTLEVRFAAYFRQYQG
jgi:hypothetical protein